VLLSFFPMKGFLGTGATFGADLNLVVQLIMGVALLGGAVLAKKKRYTAHGICQTTVLLLNLSMIELVMWPSFSNK
jgi:Ca2+/H+ antiporter